MSRIESFIRMFDASAAHGEVITRVEIPLIQRDYAQGRRGEKVEEIRQNFLAALCSAVTGEASKPIGLDFVYGERKGDGTLQPLDGQQRLTTLFLLHWYLAGRSENLESATGWTNFSYETRPSARRFCQRLVKSTPPKDAANLSAWVRNQPWYLFVWHYDPTINSMLVMIDAIEKQFGNVDPKDAWKRLSDVENPSIFFHLLPLPDMGSAEDLYIKMNSRGKPLTDFENFKARFEKVIEWSPLAPDFAHKVDTAWSDVLWPFRGGDNLVDDEFLRYFDFVTDVCEWNDGGLESGAVVKTRIQRAIHVFGIDNQKRVENLDFLFTSFDVWGGRDIKATFDGVFRSQDSSTQGSLPLFFRDPNTNLFESCCRAYGETSGNFTFGQALILLAFVIHLSEGTKDFSGRIRTLRNLIEGSLFEMRAERMPRLVADTRQIIRTGELPMPGNTFAVAQIGDESDKRNFLAEHPEAENSLWQLEDNRLIKGSTTSFMLDIEKFDARVAAFNSLMSAPDSWWDLTGALLTIGEYQSPRQRNGTLNDSDAFQFGTWDGQQGNAWREVLVGRNRLDGAKTANVFNDFLDAVAVSTNSLADTLQDLQEKWLQNCERIKSLDWRYYLVKYRSMRSGASGIYYAEGRRMGFSLTNLPGGKKNRGAYYFDPYLQSIFDVLEEPEEVNLPWFTGYEWEPRWLRLVKSGAGLRCVPGGFQMERPEADEFQAKFDDALAGLDVVNDDDDESKLIVRVAKSTEDESGPDASDRIQIGACILRRLIDAGL